MFCSLAHSIIIFKLNFYTKSLKKVNSFINLRINKKICFVFNSIEPFIRRLAAAFVFVVMNYRYQI